MQTAVIRTGGKQYSVKVGSLLRVDKLENEVDSEVVFDDVLMLNDEGKVKIGTPTLEGAKVLAKVRSQGRSKKIKIVKFKRRKHHMKTAGHRQHFTEVCISAIEKGVKLDNGS